MHFDYPPHRQPLTLSEGGSIGTVNKRGTSWIQIAEFVESWLKIYHQTGNMEFERINNRECTINKSMKSRIPIFVEFLFENQSTKFCFYRHLSTLAKTQCPFWRTKYSLLFDYLECNISACTCVEWSEKYKMKNKCKDA